MLMHMYIGGNCKKLYTTYCQDSVVCISKEQPSLFYSLFCGYVHS